MNQNTNITEVTILGFNRTPMGMRLNTSPSIDVWVNSVDEYHAYKAKIGQTAQFVARNITTRAGKVKRVYDLNVVDIPEDELEGIFTRPVFDSTEAEAKPF